MCTYSPRRFLWGYPERNERIAFLIRHRLHLIGPSLLLLHICNTDKYCRPFVAPDLKKMRQRRRIKLNSSLSTHSLKHEATKILYIYARQYFEPVISSLACVIILRLFSPVITGRGLANNILHSVRTRTGSNLTTLPKN